MKRIVIYLLVLLPVNRALSQDVIVWDSATKLNWPDFTGEEDAKSPFNAVSVTGIYFKINLGPRGFGDTILAVFYKTDSWVKKPSESQLIHEQGHFDITEIFARRFRKLRMEFIPKRGDLGHQLNALYDKIDSERDAMEEQYDRETRHSADVFMQRKWNDRIRRELMELEQYAY